MARKRTRVRIFTIGKKGKTFDAFFGALKKAGIKRLIDIRRRNTWEISAGFTVKNKLPGYLKEECGAEYFHELLLAPSDELLSAYRKNKMDWPEYEAQFMQQLTERKVEEHVRPDLFSVPTVLLCACETVDQCHRSLVLKYLQSKWPGIVVDGIHL